MFNSNLSKKGRVIYYVETKMQVEDHEETIRLYVTQLAHYPVIL